MGEVMQLGLQAVARSSHCQEFLARFIERGKDAYRAGNRSIPPPTWGRGDRFARSRVMAYIIAASRRARVWNSAAVRRICRERSSIHAVLPGVNNRMTIAQEEIFGPPAAIEWIRSGEALTVAMTRSTGWLPRCGHATERRHKTVPRLREGRRHLGELLRPRRYDPAVRRLQASGQGRDKCVEA